MYRVFVAQNRGRGLHIDFSQNVLQSVTALNRKMEKRKKKDRWRLVWFSPSFQRPEALSAKRELDRVNSHEALKNAMKKLQESTRDEVSDRGALESKVQPIMAA